VNTFPLLGSRFLITQQLDYNNVKRPFLRGPCRDGMSMGQVQKLVSSQLAESCTECSERVVKESVKRRLSRCS
jgi:hypothetical protein